MHITPVRPWNNCIRTWRVLFHFLWRISSLIAGGRSQRKKDMLRVFMRLLEKLIGSSNSSPAADVEISKRSDGFPLCRKFLCRTNFKIELLISREKLSLFDIRIQWAPSRASFTNLLLWLKERTTFVEITLYSNSSHVIYLPPVSFQYTCFCQRTKLQNVWLFFQQLFFQQRYCRIDVSGRFSLFIRVSI